MDSEWGTVRTTEGELAVEDDALRIRKPPRKFLRGQLGVLKRGTGRQRARAALTFLALVVVPVLVAAQVYDALIPSGAVGVAILAGSLGTSFVQLWREHRRGTEIELSSVADVRLDPDDRELTIVYEQVDRELTPFWVDEIAEETVRLRTDDDVREARTALRTVGVDDLTDESGPETETETEHRFETRDGVVFCPDCGTRVPPSDRLCPACGYELRVERPVDVDADVDTDAESRSGSGAGAGAGTRRRESDSVEEGDAQDREPAVEF